MNKKIALVHTPCKECIFANYDSNTQVGCALNYIEKYKKQNVEILEVYDEDKNFYVINHKKCLGYRNNKWLEKQKNKDHKTLKAIIKSENNIKYIAIVELMAEDSEEDFKLAINSLLNQYILPIGLVIYKRTWTKYNLSNEFILNYMQPHSKELKWRIKNFIDQDMSDNERLHSAIKSCDINRYYLYMKLKQNIPPDFTKKIQKNIDECKNFGCLNINDNLFFSYITIQYCQNIKHIDLLQTKELHQNYETFN